MARPLAKFKIEDQENWENRIGGTQGPRPVQARVCFHTTDSTILAARPCKGKSSSVGVRSIKHSSSNFRSKAQLQARNGPDLKVATDFDPDRRNFTTKESNLVGNVKSKQAVMDEQVTA